MVARSTRVLFTYVPFADLRSSSRQVAPLGVILAWRRDTAGCDSTTAQLRSRPTMMFSPVSGCFSLASGLTCTSCQCGCGATGFGVDGVVESSTGLRIVGVYAGRRL